MIDKIFYFIMVPMVYLAFTWCLVGIAVKIISILKAPKQPNTLKIFPEKEVSWPRLAAVLDAFSMPTIQEAQAAPMVFPGGVSHGHRSAYPGAFGSAPTGEDHVRGFSAYDRQRSGRVRC